MRVDRAWSEAANVLCVRLDALGDVLMTGPAIRALKRARPDRRVTLLTSPAGAAIARFLPGVDALITYQAPWMKATSRRQNASTDRILIARLREESFDAAAICTVYSQNPLPAAHLCYLADIPRRLAHSRENPYQLLTDWIPESEPQQGVRHEVRRQLDLVARAGATLDDDRLRLSLPPDAYTCAQVQLDALGLDAQDRWVLIHPGASAPSRRYPPDSFARAARRLVREHGCRVVFGGTPEEAGLIERIRDAMQAPSGSVAGRLDLGSYCALIALAPLLIVNNTGPAHIAAAVGTPVVDLYALTNLQHMPWAVESRVLYHDVPCKNCFKSVCPAGHHDCLRQVAPDTVVDAALELLELALGRMRQAQEA